VRLYVALLVLVLVSLACMEPIVTTTPTTTPAPAVLAPTVTTTPTLLPSPTATLSPDVAQIVAPVVNVRAKPDGDVIGTLKAGDAVTVLRCGTDPEADDYRWCSIAEPAGWVWQGCLSGNPDLRCEAK